MANAAAALGTLASITTPSDQSQEDEVESYLRREADRLTYLCRLRHAIRAAIEAGLVTHEDGIQVFEAARKRMTQ